jgi:hypothetical protein
MRGQAVKVLKMPISTLAVFRAISLSRNLNGFFRHAEKLSARASFTTTRQVRVQLIAIYGLAQCQIYSELFRNAMEKNL